MLQLNLTKHSLAEGILTQEADLVSTKSRTARTLAEWSARFHSTRLGLTEPMQCL